MLLQALIFIVATVAVFLSGDRLPVVGKTVARRLGVSATSLGLFVLAVVTSLPELSVTLTAILREQAPDLAISNILGSNNFNITVVAVLELAVAGRAFVRAVDARRYGRTFFLLLALTAIVGVGVLFGGRIRPSSITWIVLSVPIVLIFVAESATGGAAPAGDGDAPPPGASTASLAIRFSLLSIVVIVAGYFMARSANAIALHEFHTDRGAFVLGQTFMGTLVVAVATSLPEVTVAWSALRRAASPDIALGTLLGSNTVNIVVFAVGAPLLYARSRVSGWAVVDDLNLVNVAAGLVLTLLAFAATRSPWCRVSRRRTRIVTGAMIPIYLVGLYLVYARVL